MTNKLVAKSAKLKPSRAGCKSLAGLHKKDAGVIKEWACVGPNSGGTCRYDSDPSKGSPMMGWPPDLGATLNNAKTPGIPLARRDEGEGSRSQGDGGEKSGERSTAMGGSDAPMEDASAGEAGNQTNCC